MSSESKGMLLWFVASLVVIVFGYGVFVGKYKVFPYGFLSEAKSGLDWALGLKQWYYFEDTHSKPPVPVDAEQVQSGLNLVTRIDGGDRLAIEIMDNDGLIIHKYDVDWFKNWPNPAHIPNNKRPKSAPGTHIHGVHVTNDGSLLFNFEDLGLVKMGKDSSIKWRLPIVTHHSISPAVAGNFWVCGKVPRNTKQDYSYISKDYDEVLLLISPGGKVLRQHSVVDILEQNELQGLLYSRAKLTATEVSSLEGDILHLNDIEEFPVDMDEGFFKHGDLMISLRNISTILVLDPETLDVKFKVIGVVDQQHDPDFVDGYTVSIFDNNTHSLVDGVGSSRIVKITAPSGELEVVFKGTETEPFYTSIMGKHQWLNNGNILITESRGGRAFEVAPSGKLVWEYRNVINENVMGVVDEVQRLSKSYSAIFVKQ